MQKMQNENIKVYSVKTDAFTIKSSDLQKAQELLEFGADIGKWRHSKTGSDVKFPTKNFLRIETQSIELPTIKINNIPITIEQEFDTEWICKNIVKALNIILIKAKYAGSGKSYICEYMAKLVHKVLFVCPSNELAENMDTLTKTKRTKKNMEAKAVQCIHFLALFFNR